MQEFDNSYKGEKGPMVNLVGSKNQNEIFSHRDRSRNPASYFYALGWAML
jgi:hypothetical protein